MATSDVIEAIKRKKKLKNIHKTILIDGCMISINKKNFWERKKVSNNAAVRSTYIG